MIVAFSNEPHEDTCDPFALHDSDVQVDVVPRLFELVGPRVGMHTVEGLPLDRSSARAALALVPAC